MKYHISKFSLYHLELVSDVVLSNEGFDGASIVWSMFVSRVSQFWREIFLFPAILGLVLFR
jgi:hypothetical protein